MRQSHLFGKTIKQIPKDEKSVNAQLLIQAGFVDKLMAGVYNFLPLGLRVLKKIENIIREEMNAIGGQEIVMPALHPKENWLKTNRWDTMDDLYKVNDSSGKEFALGPTHEEVVVPLVKKFIHSYKDLPLYVYQFQNKFRMELRSKSGILRGREFLMKDLYSFHLKEEDLDSFYETAIEAYFKIFERTGIKNKTFLTLASGGSFSKYSHEFQTVTSAGEDTIYICNKCGLAINKEIKGETEVCPNCEGTDFKEEKSIEVGNIFKLKTKFTAPFDLNVIDENGKKREVTMGCYGIGLGRLMGTVVEVHHDDKGIIWPESLAPYQIHLILLGEGRNLAKKAEELYNVLTNPRSLVNSEFGPERNFEVLYDDRDLSAGIKLADSDLIGIPYRLILSEKTIAKDSVEFKERGGKEVKFVPLNEIIKSLKDLIVK